jgi:hypothetical protein
MNFVITWEHFPAVFGYLCYQFSPQMLYFFACRHNCLFLVDACMHGDLNIVT